MRMLRVRNGMSLWVGLLLILTSLAGAQESVESQLAPPAAPATAPGNQPASEQPKESSSDLEEVDPSPNVPGIPGWIILLSALLVTVPLVLLLIYLLQKGHLTAIKPSGPTPFQVARKRLHDLKELPTETPLAEISTRISLTVRWFLTQSKSDAALYQTREEFLTDEERLRHIPEPAKSKTADFLSELATLQYAPPTSDPEQVSTLVEKGLKTLDSLNQPEPTLPAATANA